MIVNDKKKLHLSIRIKNGEVEVRGTLEGWLDCHFFEGPARHRNFWKPKKKSTGVSSFGSQKSDWVPMARMIPRIRDFCLRKRSATVGDIICLPCKDKDTEKMITAFMKLFALRSKAQ